MQLNKTTRFISIIIFLNFFIGFISDIGLNYLSRQSYSPAAIKVLKFYFERKDIKTEFMRVFISAVNAGLTIVAALLVTMLLAYLLFGFSFPLNLYQLFLYTVLAFLIGYATDFLIYKTEFFGASLNPYYKKVGAGLWGALAFIFSIWASYILYTYSK